MKRLPFAILKNNRLFSASLLAIYVIVSVIFVIITFFYPSVMASLDSFLGNYGIADATILANVFPSQVAEEITDMEGISSASCILMLEGKTELEDGNLFTMRYSTIPEEGSQKFYSVETGCDVIADEKSVLVSSKFAEKNNVKSGDKLKVNVSGHETVLEVTDIVSCPETIYVARDVNSWFDSTQYAYVYVSEDIMSEEFGLAGIGNRLDIWFEEGYDKEIILSDVCDALKSSQINVISKTLLEDSTVYYQIHCAVDGTKAVLNYLPVIIFIIGILFCSFFIYQIIISSEKTVGTLKALGMANVKICMIFIAYSAILCTASIVIGGLLGMVVLRLLLGIYEETFALPGILISCRPIMIPIAVAAIYAIGIISCILRIRQISNYDPAVIISGEIRKKTSAVPRFVEKIHLGAYAKISLSQLFRKKKRTALMCLCNIACLILTFMSLAVLESKIVGMDFTFNERFGYDYVVISGNRESLDEVAGLDGVKSCEYAAAMVYDYEGEYLRIEAIDPGESLTADKSGAGGSLTTIRSVEGERLSVPEEGIILEEGFARRHNLEKGDEIKVGEVSFLVTDIAREYSYSTAYISLDSAKLLGVSEPGVLYVSLDNPESVEFKSQLAEIDGVDCFYSVATRKETAESNLNAIDAPCYLFVALGILIGAIIVSNMNIISIQRRRKEFATLTVIGSSGRQFAGMLMCDIIIQFVVSIIIGVPISCIVSRLVLRGMSSISMEYVLVNVPIIAIAASGAVLAYLLISLIFTRKTIDRLKLVEILAGR